MDVDVTLFPRVPLDHVGIAPLTSMFLFDESDRTRIDDFRDEVHDSDGLQIVLASGERVWRPLRNPTQLQVSSFTDVAPGVRPDPTLPPAVRLSRPGGGLSGSAERVDRAHEPMG